MTSHGSVSITSFDRLKMFPHPVTVKATALTDVGLGALSTCQLVAEVLPHAINTFTQIAFPDMSITFSRFKFSGGKNIFKFIPRFKSYSRVLKKIVFSQYIINLSAACLANVW